LFFYAGEKVGLTFVDMDLNTGRITLGKQCIAGCYDACAGQNVWDCERERNEVDGVK
jgi:hypothetical protein